MTAKPSDKKPSDRDPLQATKQNEWRIAAQARRCSHCSQPFLAGQSFYSVLNINQDSDWGFVRADACANCWPGLAPKKDASAPLIYWKTRRQEGDDDRNVVDLASMHTLFLTLIEDDRVEIEALRYVVGLMLARKKMIKVIRASGGARGDLKFKDPREGREEERLRLPIPELSEESLERLKEQLGSILV